MGEIFFLIFQLVNMWMSIVFDGGFVVVAAAAAILLLSLLFVPTGWVGVSIMWPAETDVIISTLSRVWQHLKLSDVSHGARPLLTRMLRNQTYKQTNIRPTVPGLSLSGSKPMEAKTSLCWIKLHEKNYSWHFFIWYITRVHQARNPGSWTMKDQTVTPTEN